MGATLLLTLLLLVLSGTAAVEPARATIGDLWPLERGADLRAALARLEAPEAAERRAAERFLARSLRADDLSELARAIPGLGLEGRARLATALGSDPTHFELAALLVCERDPALFELGELALRRQLERWFGSPDLPPTPRREVAAALDGHFADRLFQVTVGARPVDEELGLLLRHIGIPEGLPGAGPLALALDPALYAAGLEAGATAPGTALTGEPDVLLRATVDAHGEAELEGFAMDGPRSFLHVTHRSRAGARDGAELFTEWCRALVLDGGAEGARGARAEGAARALAATGFPVALEWLAARWERAGDRRALSGLLLAAERGWVSPSLARADAVERLLAAADEGLERGGALERRFAEEVARALGRLGALADGAALAELLARGLVDAPRGRAALARHRMRLGALAGLGRLPPQTARLLRARLASRGPAAGGASDPRLATDQLRALARAAFTAEPAPFLLADPTPFFGRDEGPAVYPLHDRWLAAAGARPPADWGGADALALEGGPAAILRARLVSWWLRAAPEGVEAPEQLARLVRAIEAVGEPLGAAGAERNAADRLADELARAGRGRLRLLFDRARTALGPATPALGERLDRLEVFAGVADGAGQARVLDRLLERGEVATSDLELLGAVAGSLEEPAGPRAREALRVSLRARLRDARGTGAEVLSAVERALVGLAADPAPRGRVSRVEEELVQGLLRELIGDGPRPGEEKADWSPTLLQLLRTPGWPGLPRLAPLPLAALEVQL